MIVVNKQYIACLHIYIWSFRDDTSFDVCKQACWCLDQHIRATCFKSFVIQCHAILYFMLTGREGLCRLILNTISACIHLGV